MIGRREFLTVAGGAALGWPLAGRAQRADLPVIGVLNGQSPDPVLLAAFHEGLNANGYVEGRNVAIDYRWAHARYQQLPAQAEDLVRRAVRVIFAAGGGHAIAAARAATATIPIIFATGGDPVAMGLVASLSRPGASMTGVTWLLTELEQKRLELLTEMLPSIDAIAVLVNPTNINYAAQLGDFAEAGRILGRELRFFNASTGGEIDAAFAAMAEQGAEALVVSSDPFFAQSQREHVVALAARHRLPAIYASRDWAAAGGLMSYGTSGNAAAYAQAGRYVGRILDGDDPAELPVVQVSTFGFALNLRTAASLGITVPPSILIQATEVIE